MGAPGHSIEDCITFKRNVLDLVDSNHIQLKTEGNSTIATDPLPNHERQVNAIEKDVGFSKSPTNIEIPMKALYSYLQMMGYVSKLPGSEGDGVSSQDSTYCEYHQKVMSHDIENCAQFKEFVRKMMVSGVVVSRKVRQEVCMMEKKAVEFVIKRSVPKEPTEIIPFVINTTSNKAHMTTPLPPKQLALTINIPSPFPYESNRAVPWRYHGIVEDSSHSTTVTGTSTDLVTNISGTGGITRSGRVYLPPDTRKAARGKEVVNDDPETSDTRQAENTGDEFLQIMKQSDYSVVDQLKKTPARISMLSLILNSEAHRRALQEVLDQAYVQPNITPEKVANVMNVVKAASTISFSEEEIVKTAIHQSKALHITLKCKGFVVARVLIDGGSALNVLPLSTFELLSVETSSITNSNLVVKAFDGSKREVMGTVCLPLEIGPSTFRVDFQLMDIDPTYTMLLGRPWIHSAGAVPSTLHQKVKFIGNGGIITVKGEEEIMVSKPSSLPYIEATKKDNGMSFQSFEVEGFHDCTKNVNSIVSKIMARSRFVQGKGLGMQLQGITSPIVLLENPKQQGLGYEPTLEDQMREQTSITKGKEAKKPKIPHIKETFPAPAEVINQPDISMVSLDGKRACETHAWIKVDGLRKALANWELESVPDIISLE